MTVNARRTRRSTPAAAEAEPLQEPAPTPEPARRQSSSTTRRRSPSSGRVVAFPEPTISPTAGPAPQYYSASAAPPVPHEEPAVLHAADRRSFAGAVRASFPAAVEQLAIGELDQTLFDCPECRRPLALGARRCPGCGTHLIRSVAARKAAVFVAAGLLVGAVAGLGGGVVLGAGLAGYAAVIAAPSDAPSASTAGSVTSPSQTASATSTPAPVPTVTPVSTMPSVVRGALVQALAANDRLGVAESELRAALAAPRFDASTVAATMRTISADSVFGEQLAPPVTAWSGGAELGPALATFYGTVHDSAATALDNSVQNVAGYKAAARSMANLLAGRTLIDAAIRAAASASGVSLPASTTAP